MLQAAAERWGFALSFEQMEWASCEYYSHHGKMMPDDWHEQLSRFDAIYFGAVGWPDTVPDHISLWGSLLKFRREFDQYVNLRPVRLFPWRSLARWRENSPATSIFTWSGEKHRRRIFLARR